MQLRGPVLLPPWQRRSVYTSVGVLSATGMGWLAVHFFGPATQELATGGWSWPQVNHGLMQIHAVAALWLCILVGSLLPVHVNGAWQRRLHRGSGGANLVAFSLLTLTGYALWYAPEGGLRDWSSWMHWGFGVAAPLGLWLHIALGRRARRFAWVQ